MPRLVHLVRASSARTIERAGIHGGAAHVRLVGRRPSTIDPAVFAMPVVPDFSVTYQWMRELRRWHGERLVAVHIILRSSEEVYVGRYNLAHGRLPLGEAIKRVLNEPAGNEIIIPRSITKKEVAGIRDVTQLVGWTEVPEPKSRFDCVCQMCLPPGTPDLMRRVNAAFTRHLAEARSAKSVSDCLGALRRLDVPLERANGRLRPTKLLFFTRAESADVRRLVASLLGYFRAADVAAPLARLIHDPDERVRANAVEAHVRQGT